MQAPSSGEPCKPPNSGEFGYEARRQDFCRTRHFRPSAFSFVVKSSWYMLAFFGLQTSHVRAESSCLMANCLTRSVTMLCFRVLFPAALVLAGFLVYCCPIAIPAAPDVTEKARKFVAA